VPFVRDGLACFDRLSMTSRCVPSRDELRLESTLLLQRRDVAEILAGLLGS